MDWKTLLSTQRLGFRPRTGEAQPLGPRSEGQRDYDRIVFSPAFRRLQGKTQVFPLPESDMTHTRLTHSLETSCVGRSLGWMVAGRIDALKPFQSEASTIVQTASLAHDLGNPPFGHSGEKAIGHYFKHGSGERFLEGLSGVQKVQLTKFEGNALGFRLLTRRNPIQSEANGLSLTCLTLGAFSKYPCTAVKEDESRGVHRKKFGVFDDDLPALREVASVVGLSSDDEDCWHRHPLAYLTEAADDICYRVIDLEDGFKLNLVSADRCESILKRLTAVVGDPLKGLEAIRAPDQRIAYLRAKAINSLAHQVVDVFVAEEAALLAGAKRESLLESTPSREIVKELDELSREDIYSHHPVIEIEAAGFEIIGTLLEAFLSSALAKKRTARDKKFLSLVPQHYLPQKEDHLGTQILNICEFVASMTDAYAIRLYRTLRGISLPNSRP